MTALTAAALLTIMAVAHPQPAVAAVTIAYPDLQMFVPEQDIQIYHPVGAAKELRYTHVVANLGDGPLDILPVYDSTTQTAVGYQRLYGYDSSGKLTLVSQTQIADRFYFHPAHDHYHFPFAQYGLYAVNPDGSVGSQVVVSPKVGFCIAEDQQVDLTLPHAPPGWVYNGNTCYDPTAVRGLSVGWGDMYDWIDPGQNIDITNVPDGTYWFRSTADPNNDFQEKDKTNNTTGVKLQVSGDAVRVVNPIASAGNITVDQSYFQNGSGTTTTPAFSTSASGEWLLAFASSAGPSSGGQTLTVSGGGLNWTLAQRTNTQAGTAEVWSAYAGTRLNGAMVTSSQAKSGYDQSVAVIALQGAAGIGAVGGASGPNATQGTTLTSTRAGSWMLGAGFDSDNAIYRTLGPGQTMLHQWVNFSSTGTFWAQAVSQPAPAAGVAIQLSDTAPCCDRWNFTAVEVLPAGPASVPAAPTGVNATPLDSAATVSWTAPANGGSPINKYTVTPFAGTTAQPSTDVIGSPPATSATVGGLTNGTTYTFTVTASNPVGTGPPSAASNPITPAGPTAPGAPTGISATAGNASAALSWTAPGSGGSPITKYTVTPWVGTNFQPSTDVIGSPPATSATIGGLTNGTTYTFTVTATNAVGIGPASAASNPVTPTTVPLSIDQQPIYKDGHGTVTTSAFGTSGPGELLVAFVASDGPAGGGQTATVSGAGLTWSLARRTNTQAGTAEIWSATASNQLSGATVTSSQSSAGYDQSLTVIAFKGASGVGNLGGASAASGAPSVAVTTSRAGSWVFGVGNDWDRAIARTVGPNQVKEHEWADSGAGTFWVQATTGPTLTAGTAVVLNDTAPTTDRWDFAAVEVLPGSLTMPGPPTSVGAIAGNALATVNWTAPANGGSPITGYTVTSSPGGVTASAGASATSAVISPLVNGTSYTFTVTATNAVGTSSPSTASNAITPRGPPGPPSNVSATAGNALATVSWTPPASTGGSSIVSYTVTSSPGGVTASAGASATSAAVSPLVNGTSYTFTVTATNAVGTSSPSAASNATTPSGPPGPPTNVAATAGNAQATVSWTPPASNGGSSIIGYTVTSSPGGVTASAGASATSALVSPLVNGTSYSFTVTASNVVGTSSPSAPSNPVTPSAPTPPGPPTNVSATAGNAQATVSWTTPTSNGGSPITGYTVTSSPEGVTASAGASATSGAVSPLVNGTSYTFTVTATNAVGTSAPSAASNSVTPATAPGPPSNASATAGNAQATVSWNPPASNGGSSIIGYTVTSSPGAVTASAGASATSALVSPLVNGTSYSFTVTATNAAGTSSPSAPSNAATPSGPPGPPTNAAATAGNSQAVVSWTAPGSNGGSPITGYTVTSSPGGVTASAGASATSVVVSPLVNGTSYSFTVTATNVMGTSPSSAPSNSVTPGTAPGPPSNVTAMAGNAQATVSWSPPTSNGGNPITGYTVTSSPGGVTASVGASATGAMVSPLVNGTSYTFTVTATSAAGTSAPSAASNTVTPAGPPGAPTNVTATAGNAQATVNWNPPGSNSGSPITGYTVTSSPGGVTASAGASATGAVVSPLVNGTSYTFTVTATNAAGTGAPSGPSNAVTPAGSPGAPTNISATAGNASAAVSWLAPANGGSPITKYTVTPWVGTAFQPSTDVTGSPPATSVTIAGLTNGTTYTFAVAATNAVGTGPQSLPSNAVTPKTYSQISIDQMVYRDAHGTVTTPSFTTAGPGEALVAFVASDGPASGGQTVTVSGGGLTWSLARRTNTQAGTAEIWSAFASSKLSGVTVTSTQGKTGYDQSLTMLAFKGASGVGNAGGASAASGAQAVTVTTSRAGSWVFGVGNDWDNPVGRTLGPNQVVEHQWVDTGVGDTYWVQAMSGQTGTAGTAVQLNDTAPTTDRWNYAAVEVLAS